MKVHRSTNEPVRTARSWDDRWGSLENGLITSWERGRERAIVEPELATAARDGKLVLLPWKGGVAKETKSKKKYGSLFYLATWQGLRGDDLNIDTASEQSVVCRVTDQEVIFTADNSKFVVEE